LAEDDLGDLGGGRVVLGDLAQELVEAADAGLSDPQVA
jgi:hypothetical protein